MGSSKRRAAGAEGASATTILVLAAAAASSTGACLPRGADALAFRPTAAAPTIGGHLLETPQRCASGLTATYGRGAPRRSAVRPRAGYAAAFPSSSSSSSSTRLNLLKGLVSSVDDLINQEEEEARRSPASVLASTFRVMIAAPTPADALGIFRSEMEALVDRTNAATGDTENEVRLLRGIRNYANDGLVERDLSSLPPVLDDLNQPDPPFAEAYWSSPPFRMTVIGGSFFFFPYLTTFLRTVIEINENEYEIINGQFGPGVGVLYGTFTALTLEILYQRQCNIQENATLEASLLAQVTQNVLSLFRDDPSVAREASQIVADQVRVIASRSRGGEMLVIMRADPYARILSLVDRFQKSREDFTLQEEALIECLRGEIPQLMEARARRLSDEASELPPTHFLVLSLLTGLSLIGFTSATLTIVGADGKPPLESRLVFAGLTAIFFLFYNFCRDLNNPFGGVYQIKRAGAASYLLQIKALIAAQEFGETVMFGTGGFRQAYDGPDLACEDECVIEGEEEDEQSPPSLAPTAVASTAVVIKEAVDAKGDADAEVICVVEEECDMDADEVILLDDWDDDDDDEAFYDNGMGGWEDDYYGDDEEEARVEASAEEATIAVGAAATTAVVTGAAMPAGEPSHPPPAPAVPPEADPALLYFMGTSGFGGTYSAEAAETAAAEARERADAALVGSAEVLRADELLRREKLAEKRSRFGEDWRREALGGRDVRAREREKVGETTNGKRVPQQPEKAEAGVIAER